MLISTQESNFSSSGEYLLKLIKISGQVATFESLDVLQILRSTETMNTDHMRPNEERSPIKVIIISM